MGMKERRDRRVSLALRRAEKSSDGGVGTLPFVFKQEWPGFNVKLSALLHLPSCSHTHLAALQENVGVSA